MLESTWRANKLQQLSTNFISSCRSKAQAQKNSMKKLKKKSQSNTLLFLTLFGKCLNEIFLKPF